MSQQKPKAISRSRETVRAPLHTFDSEDEESGSSNEGSEIMAKDEAEEELDRLVLGDSAGFLDNLRRQMDLDEENSDNERGGADLEGDAGLEGVDDADLFFLDSGPSAIDSSALALRIGSEEEVEGRGAAAWEDSDDERLAISLAGHNRLRKLRLHEGEDMVSGREYTKRLRRQFERLNPAPEWTQTSTRPAKRRRRSSAASGSSSSSDDEMDIENQDLSALPLARLLQDSNSLSRTPATTTKKPKLRPKVIDIQRTRDIPGVQPSAIASLNFHPEYPVLLSSGLASTLYLHHIAPAANPIPNPLLTSVHIQKTPLHTSAFLGPKGDKIFFSSRRPYFHTWELNSGVIQKVSRVYGHKEEQRSMERFKLSPCGRYMALAGSSKKGGGLVNILDSSTTQWIASARIEGRNGVADYAWWSTGEGLTIVGKGGEVGEWSMESRSFVARWMDDGHAPTVLTLGGRNGPKQLGGDRWIVIGSQSGIVNIYDRLSFVSSTTKDILIPERPQPKRSFDQLKRATSNLEISPDGQILVISTQWEKDALRLVHLPSCTVYKNWPTGQTPLGRVTAVAFSSGSDILAVGNEQGKIRLFEIRA